MLEILPLFHHLHHKNKKHETHHCGGSHKKINPKLNYTIRHCPCGRHSIDKKIAIGHATDKFMEPMEVRVEFTEKCPFGGWHIESGKRLSERRKNKSNKIK